MKKNKGETMKVLFLGSQNIKENVTSGGMQFSKRNFDCKEYSPIRRTVGRTN